MNEMLPLNASVGGVRRRRPVIYLPKQTLKHIQYNNIKQHNQNNNN